jgi:hypothetical protein
MAVTTGVDEGLADLAGHANADNGNENKDVDKSTHDGLAIGRAIQSRPHPMKC